MTDLIFGFVAVGIAPGRLAPAAGERLRDWLADGCHGEMLWMESRADERASPDALWAQVRSVVMLGMSYAPAAVRGPKRLAGAGAPCQAMRLDVADERNLTAGLLRSFR